MRSRRVALRVNATSCYAAKTNPMAKQPAMMLGSSVLYVSSAAIRVHRAGGTRVEGAP